MQAASKENSVRHRAGDVPVNKANKQSRDASPDHRAGTPQHRQPADGYRSHIDLSPEPTISSPSKPQVNEKEKEREDAGKQSWRAWCTGRGLKAGDEEIKGLLQQNQHLLEKPLPQQQRLGLLEEGGNKDGKLNTLVIFSPKEKALRDALLDQALLMRARNDCKDDLDLAAQELLGVQGEYDAALANRAPENTLSDLRAKIETLTRLAQRELDYLKKTQDNVEDGHQQVVDMLKGNIPARRLLRPDGQMARAGELAGPPPLVIVGPGGPFELAVRPAPVLVGAVEVAEAGPFAFEFADRGVWADPAELDGVGELVPVREFPRIGGFQLATVLQAAGLAVLLHGVTGYAFETNFVTACICVCFAAAICDVLDRQRGAQ